MLSNPASVSDSRSSADFRSRFVAPGHSDDVKSLVIAGRSRLGVQHGRAGLFRGVNGLHPCAEAHLEIVVIKDGAVGVAALHQDPADRRRCQRQPKYRVQICTSIAAQCPCAAASDQTVDAVVRERRKDRDSVVSSVYPG